MGQIIKKTKNGAFIGWYIRFIDCDGKRKAKATHQPTRELARRFLVDVEARVARGQQGIVEPAPAAPSVAELCRRFLTEYSRPRIKDLGRYRASASTGLRRLLPVLGKLRADAVQTADVVRARDTIAATASPASVKLSLAFLAAVYAWAVRQHIVTTNPVRGVERPTAHPSVDFFGREEVAALLAALEGAGAVGHAGAASAAPTAMNTHRLAVCVRLVLHTGLRKGELLGLRWQDLDLETRRLTVARSYKLAPKSGKTRHLALPAECVPDLRAWRPICPRTAEGLVFPVSRAGDCPDASMLGLPALLTRAGLRVPAHPWHCLRHTFASHFVMQGGNILSLQRILGHADIKQTLVYAHLAPDFLRAEMDRLNYRAAARSVERGEIGSSSADSLAT